MGHPLWELGGGCYGVVATYWYVAQDARGIVKEQRDEKRHFEEKRLDRGEGISPSESDQFLPSWNLSCFTSIRLLKLSSNNNQKKSDKINLVMYLP